MADEAKMLEAMRKRFSRSLSARQTSRMSQLDDLKFAAGSPDNQWQWDELALANRKADPNAVRPTLTINQLPQHINQVKNEARQNRPAGKTLPVDDKADPKTADVFNGLIRHVEVSSDADIALDIASEAQATHGEGYYRIVAEHCDPMSFDQDLRIKLVLNSFSVYDDPDIQDPVGIDRKWCFLVEELTKEEFEFAWPDADVVSMSQAGVGDTNLRDWFNEGKIRVAEYYRIERVRKTIRMWQDGRVTVKGDPVEAQLLAAGFVQAVKPDGSPVERETVIPRILWLKSNGYQVLTKEKEIPGSFIPLFRVVGNQWVVDGEVVVSGIVRNAKDAQRMVNYWTSQEAEMLALAPKAPFVGAAGAFKGYESKWRTANLVNYPYLEYNPIVEGEVLAPAPQRQQPPMPPAGIIEAKLQALDAVKQTTGQYDPSLGAVSNETSGKAILARQRETDVGTFHYIDNLARAVRAHCRYIVEVAPIYYDARRVARIIGEDGTPDQAKLDPTMPQAYAERQGEDGAIERIYNLNVGKYDVISSVGPSYTTKRQEAVDQITQLLQGNKEMWAVFGDLLAKNMDWPGAEEIAERIKRWIASMNPKLLSDDKEGDQKLAQAMQMVEQLTQALQAAQESIDQQKVDIEAFNAETKRIVALAKSMGLEQMQDIVLGTIAAMETSTDIDPGAEGASPPMRPPQPPQAPPMAPPMQ